MSYRGGSAGKDQKIFANILDYLERDHRPVYELIDNLGVKSYLNARKGRGVTFLIPDEKTVKQLRALADSEDDNKVADAVDLILTHILPRLYEDAAQMDDEKSDIGTALSRKLEVKEVKGDKVYTKSGAEITKDKKFLHNSRVGNSSRGGSSVWIVKGELEYKDAPVTENTYLNKEKSVTKKGAEEKTNFVDENVAIYGGLKTYEDHCALVCRVLNFWRAKSDMYSTELSHAKILFGKNARFNSFVLLRVPGVFNPQSVRDAAVAGLSDKDRTNFEEFMSVDIPNAGLLATADGRQKFCDAIGTQTEIIQNLKNFKEKALKIVELYEKVDSSNSFGRLSGLYPESLAKIFAQSKTLHMQLDTLRYAFCFIHNNAKTEEQIAIHVDEAVRMTSGLLRGQETSPFILTLSRRELFDSKPEQDDTLDSFIKNGFLFCANCCHVSGADEDDDSADLGIYMGANETVFESENAKSMKDDEYVFNPNVIAQLKKFVEKGGDLQTLIAV